VQERNVAEKVYERYEVMVESKSAKIEQLYKEIGELKERIIKLTYEKNEMQLTNKIALTHKCEVRGCAQRKPPSDY